ncbi:MAG: hypothetical protein EPO20_24575 [Betaproteobacteria bacterium]|nr:MAG: hypothetical protein EPO20_24575 [Betaproteobacteria bacterium]
MASHRALLALALLLLALTFEALAQDRPRFLGRIERSLPADCRGKVYCLGIWIGYKFPENVDLSADARSQESKCLNARIVTEQACSDSDSCRRDVEASFRRCISGIPGAEFWVAADDPNNMSRGLISLFTISSDEVVGYRRRTAPGGSLDQRFTKLTRASQYVWTGQAFVFKRSSSGEKLDVDERSCAVVTDLGMDDPDHETHRISTRTAGCTPGGVCAYTYSPNGWNIWAYICDGLYDKIH